ncbi:putative glutathione transferase omega [Triangularia verruculosa]|uniref:Glutathione transferase omega n=1 Tax=Triangularia verruculosa TaxID=2587418 RepID=A0AAN7ARN1_9PEZI|nr:putative glutathione transferase omega [Triangularia verruculosa]
MNIRTGVLPLLRGTTITTRHRFLFPFTILPISHRYISTTHSVKMAAQDTPSGKESKSNDNVITNWVKPGDKSGEFKRQQSTFRSFISSSPDSEFPAEAGRYHLYVSLACPWANRTLIARKLKGLEDFISFSAVHWHMGSQGWRFVTPDETDQEDVKGEGVVPHDEGLTHIRELYFSVNPEYEGRFTVPVLWDKKTKRIVNNESSEILRMLNTEFNNLITDPFKSVDLYPEDLRKQIDEANEWQYDLISNGVYKSGFATTQEAYEKNVKALFEALDRAEKHLTDNPGPYWFGERLTEVDIRLFVTLIRFDPVYVQHFKCNIRDIRSGYPAIHKWMRNLYWGIPAFKDTTNFNHIKFHYTKSHPNINPVSITPLGPVPDILPRWEEVPAVSFRG